MKITYNTRRLELVLDTLMIAWVVACLSAVWSGFIHESALVSHIVGVSLWFAWPIWWIIDRIQIRRLKHQIEVERESARAKIQLAQLAIAQRDEVIAMYKSLADAAVEAAPMRGPNGRFVKRGE